MPDIPDNQDRFDLLCKEHGNDSQIPNDILYAYLLETREDLCDVMQLGVDHIPNSRLGKEVRRRCQVDLMWMARYFTWGSNPISDNGNLPFTENIFDEEFYGPFTKLFVQKDPSKSLNQQSEVKTRLLLWPRGGAKSTFDHVDTVQWILCFPAIRILYLTAEKSLAEGFVGEIKGHFFIKETPTLMNLFWPEFCVEDTKAGAMNEFTCPVYAAKKTGRKEPTVYASSVGKNKAGWRYELIKADDAVSDTNSETSFLCEKISRALFLAEKLLALGGFYVDYIGTRYEGGDHYGVVLEQNLVGEIQTTFGLGWEFIENRTTRTNILIGRAIQICPEVKQRLENEGKPTTYQEAGPDGCILLLPHLMSFSWCMGDLTKDEKSFEGQRNQNPRTQGDIVFERMQLVKATVPFTLLPRFGPISQFWDLSFSQKKGTDFCVGSSVVWGEEDVAGPDGKPVEFQGQNNQKIREKKTVGYVRKIIRDRFNPFTIAQAIVQLAVEDRPFVIGIEKGGGSEMLKPTIEAEAQKTRDPFIIALCSNIDWVTPDNQNDAKRIRMGGLLPWVLDGRMKFLNACMQPKYQDLEILYSEFEKCMSDHHHDDIPDNLGYQPRYAPRATQALINNETDMFGSFERQGWEQIYNEGTGQAYYPDENGNLVPWETPQPMFDDFAPEPEVQSASPFGMDNILGSGFFG